MRARWWIVLGAVAVLVVVLARRSTWRSEEAKLLDVATTRHHLALKALAADAPVDADLYLPKSGKAKTPLVVWLEGNEPGPPTVATTFGGEVGDALQRSGMAGLALSFRASSATPLRRCAGDVAAAVAEVDRSGEFSRIVLAGRGSGAWMASMLALDRTLLEQAGVDPKRVAGVVAIRGTYDLSDAALEGHPHREFFLAAADARDPQSSSPAAFARGDAPQFLLLTGGGDDGTFPRLARSFMHVLEKAGARVESYVVPDHDAYNMTQWAGERNELGSLVLSFVASGFREFPIDSTFGVRQRWSNQPPLDNDELRADKKRIASFPVDAEFIRAVAIPLGKSPFELNVLPGKTYDAIDLLSYVASRPESEVGTGDYLVVTNMRDEKLYLTRQDLEAYKPLIVVGMDDETNLYRIFTHYRLKQAYSWKKGEEPMPTMIRPIGAFVHFRAPPPHLRNNSFMPFGVTSKSFRWVKDDPLGPVRELPVPLRDTLIGSQGCLKCHSLRGTGARSHHNLALDGKPYGAFALPLEEYPTEVLRRFLFDQDTVARSFDVTPLHVEASIARSLFDLVTGPSPSH
jgi:acetyl esterase/lipase